MANYKNQLEAMGFRYDDLSAAGYNKINQISYIVRINAASQEFTVSAACRPLDENNIPALSAALNTFMAERKKMLKTAVFDGKQIVICYQLGLSTNIGQYVNDAVQTIMFYINQFNCVPCCNHCGQLISTNIYTIENSVTAICEDCFASCQRNISQNIQTDAETITNYPMGTLGAVLGGLLGAVIWIVFSLLGKISVWAGLFAGSAGIYGFKWLGKKITPAAIVISVIVSLGLLVTGMYIAIGIDLHQELSSYGYDVSFSQALEFFPELMEDPDYRGAIIYNNVWGFVTYALAAVITAIQVNKEKKVKNRAFQLM